MNIENWTRKTSKGFYSITEVGAWIGAIVTAGITLLVFVDVCGRYFLRKPVPGSYELVEQGMVVLGGFAIMYAALKGGHVAIDLIFSRFSRRTQMIMQSIFSFIGFGTSVVMAYQVYLLGLYRLERGQTTVSLGIIKAPFMFILAAALFLCGLTLLIQTFRPVASDETMEVKE